jgi:tRNA A37 threonylcarbamoyladenosine modification protein TsaB
LINSIAVPLQIGLYQAGQCIEKREPEGQTSEVLLPELEELLEQYSIEKILYVNGPGSYMAIKLTYITLCTIEMIRGIGFAGVSAFELNGGKPIKAIGHLYFTKEKETIITQKFDEKVMQEFWLPDDLSALSLEKKNTPHYILPAV